MFQKNQKGFSLSPPLILKTIFRTKVFQRIFTCFLLDYFTKGYLKDSCVSSFIWLIYWFYTYKTNFLPALRGNHKAKANAAPKSRTQLMTEI